MNIAGYDILTIRGRFKKIKVFRKRLWQHWWKSFFLSPTSFCLTMVRSRGVTAFYHTQWHTTVGRTPLDEGSARRRDLYLTTHNTDDRQTSMSPAGFEPAIPAGDWPQTLTLELMKITTNDKSLPLICTPPPFSSLFRIMITMPSRWLRVITPSRAISCVNLRQQPDRPSISITLNTGGPVTQNNDDPLRSDWCGWRVMKTSGIQWRMTNTQYRDKCMGYRKVEGFKG
jgi:hypothetical protein